MKKIYISGAITDVPNDNKEAFEKAETFLREKGYEPVNPHKLDHSNDVTHADHMHTDLQELLACDGVYFLQGWRYSTGAKVEMAVALAIDLDIDFEPKELEVV